MSARPHLPGCVLNPEHEGECTTVPELVDVGQSPRPSQPLQKVEVASSEPPLAKRRSEDRLRLRDQDWRSQFVAGFKWTFAPVVRDWHGLSLIRLLSIATAIATNEIAHDWVNAAEIAKVNLGWAFGAFVLSGFFLAAILALGEKYIDKLITIIGAKLGVVLVNAPLPDILTERSVKLTPPKEAP